MSRNRIINSYLEKETYKAFIEFCEERGCSYYDGVELLIRQFLLKNPKPVNQEGETTNVVEQRLALLEEAIAQLTERLEKLEGVKQTPGITKESLSCIFEEPEATR